MFLRNKQMRHNIPWNRYGMVSWFRQHSFRLCGLRDFALNISSTPMYNFTIKPDDLSSPEIAELLADHLREMNQHSPPESVHALDLDKLRQPDITFWSIWHGDELFGCGALKELDATHAEIKSMRTSPNYRGQGAGKLMLRHILDEAKQKGYQRLSLETGSMAAFEPARRLYASHGFTDCSPFADYTLDPNSVFMTIKLG